jgi:hypothetical protein
MNKIVELLIDWDNMEFDDLGVDIMSLVESPAIQIGWQAFSDEETNEYQKIVLEMAQQDDFGQWYDPEEMLFIDTTKEEFADPSEIISAIEAVDRIADIAGDSQGEIKYRYAGRLKANSRFFCRTMIGLNKLYSPTELAVLGNAARSVSSSLYPQRSFVEDDEETVSGGVGQWMGGPNCGHYWQKLRVYPSGVSQVLGRADGGDMGKPMIDRSNGGRQNFAFADLDQQIIVGPAMVADQKILRQDEDGNPFHVFFSAETIKKISEKFLADSKHNQTDINHNGDVVKENTLLESWIVEDNQMDKSRMYGFDLPVGTWMAMYRINDDKTWAKIKNGELSGYSVEGQFIEKLIK